jgi:hypothetical protein
MSLIGLFIAVLVIFCLAWLGFWVIGQAFPPPIQQIAKIILGAVIFVFILMLLLQVTGVGGEFGSMQIGRPLLR